MEIASFPLSKLTPAPYNPRKISKAALSGLENSIKRFGLVQPIVWNKRTDRVVGGHQRIKALQSSGETNADVVVVDLPENEEKALNLALNNPAIEGTFTDELQGILDEIRIKEPKLYDDLLLRELVQEVTRSTSANADEIPENVETITSPGETWLLGDHHLLCGDSTNISHVDEFLESKKVQMIFTDPPWNVAIGQDLNPRHRQRKGLENDDLGVGFSGFIESWTKACLPYLDGDIYCVMGCEEWPTIDQAMRDCGMHWSATIVWVKDLFVLGRSQYHRRFEPIWYGWPSKSKSSYLGSRDQDDVWEIPRPRVSQEHPTMKPVELVEKAIRNSSKRGDVVFDPFLGAGSTLIAADRLERTCYGIEISPQFCDVTVARWEKLTGKKAQRISEVVAA